MASTFCQKKIMKILKVLFAFLLIIFSTFLLGLHIYGRFMPPITPEVITAKDPVPGHEYRTISVQEAIKQFNELKLSKLNDKDKIKKLLDLIYFSYIHGDPNEKDGAYKLAPRDNWLMWLNATRYKSIYEKEPTDADLLWRRGVGICNQASIIFVEKAKELNIEGRLVGLTGHYVAEVKINGKWHLADANVGGVLFSFGIEEVDKSNHSEIIEKYTKQGFTQDYANKLSELYFSKENNTFSVFPSLMQSTRYNRERNVKLFNWLIPCLGLGIGIFLLSYGRRV